MQRRRRGSASVMAQAKKRGRDGQEGRTRGMLTAAARLAFSKERERNQKGQRSADQKKDGRGGRRLNSLKLADPSSRLRGPASQCTERDASSSPTSSSSRPSRHRRLAQVDRRLRDRWGRPRSSSSCRGGYRRLSAWLGRKHRRPTCSCSWFRSKHGRLGLERGRGSRAWAGGGGRGASG